MSHEMVLSTIDDYARSAALAAEANYDGVEIMGSEGYLINQFIASRTNKRSDQWGGSYENRIKLALEVVRKCRESVNPDFIIMFRLSMLDLVEGGSTWPEVVQLAQELEGAGVDIINTGAQGGQNPSKSLDITPEPRARRNGELFLLLRCCAV